MRVCLLHGLYWCVSPNSNMIDCMYYVTDANLIGQPRPPEVVQPLQSQTAHDGDSVHLQCVITGNPRPNIVWFHSTKVIKPTPEFRQFYDDTDFVCSLEIREAFPEDTGRYTIVAKNELGTVSCSADLSVCENEAMRRK